MELTNEEKQIFCEVSGDFEVPAGAYNFRVNGKSVGRSSTANIDVKPKKNNQGLDVLNHRMAIWMIQIATKIYRPQNSVLLLCSIWNLHT